MDKIVIINTGGTFNKVYDPISGNLGIDKNGDILNQILKFCHNTNYELHNIIHKDSIYINEEDREKIVSIIENSSYTKFLIIHGTDTIDLTSKYLQKRLP